MQSNSWHMPHFINAGPHQTVSHENDRKAGDFQCGIDMEISCKNYGFSWSQTEHSCNKNKEQKWSTESFPSLFWCMRVSDCHPLHAERLFRGEQWPIWRNTFAKCVHVHTRCVVAVARFIARRRWHVYVTFHCNWIFVDVIRSVGP